MVKHIKRGGLFDWLAQRCSAVIIAVYTIFIISYIAIEQPEFGYSDWHNLFISPWMQTFTVIVLVSVLWHAWIGLWTVFTDYVKNKAVRLVLEVLVILMLLAYFIWLLETLW